MSRKSSTKKAVTKKAVSPSARKSADPDAGGSTSTPAKKTGAATKRAAAKKTAPTKATTKATRVRAKKASPAPAARRQLPSARLGVRPPILSRAAVSIQLAPGDSRNLGPIAGTGSSTGALGAGATDLCEIAPSGLVALAGDTFAGDSEGALPWSPSMGLRVRAGSLNDTITGVQFDRSFGGGGTLYADPRPPQATSQLPAGTIQVFGIDYALVANVVSLEPINTRLVQIDPNNGNWPTVPESGRDASWQWENQTQISGYQAPDGWVYIVADGFSRHHPVWLYRTRAENFRDRNSWHAWGIGDDGNWKWDVAPAPLSDDIWGELSFRLIGGKAVLSGFNASNYQIEVHVADDPTQVLNPDNSALTVVATGQELPQLYGGYIVPGSTLDNALILVSQWNTDPNGPHIPYNVQEFVVNLNR